VRESPIEFTPTPNVTAVVELAKAATRDRALRGPDIQTDAGRLAREMKASGQRTFGILPASPIDLVPLMTELGYALALLTDALVLSLLPERTAGVLEVGTKGSSDIYAAMLAPMVVALAPERVAPPGEKDRGIRAMMDFMKDRGDAFGHMFVDLSGCVRPGELLGAVGLLDRFIVVGHVGNTTETDLVNVVRHLPQQASLGVLLIQG
jgi:hypothetical protein